MTEYTFGIFKNNFKNGDRVIIGKTSSELDGTKGTISGKTYENVFDQYIVVLDESFKDNKIINITEVCLSKV